MGDADHKPPQHWMRDDSQVILATLATLTLATSSILLWRGKRRPPPEASSAGPSVLQSALATLHISKILSPSTLVDPISEPEALPNRDGLDDIGQGGNADGTKEAKSSRSKERRRRGKDPLKDISKGGKKFKELRELLRTTKRPTTASSEDSMEPAVAPLDRSALSPKGKESVGSSTTGAPQSSRSSSRNSSQQHSSPTPVAEDTIPKPTPSARDVPEPPLGLDDTPSRPQRHSRDTALNPSHPADTQSDISSPEMIPVVPDSPSNTSPAINGTAKTSNSPSDALTSHLISPSWSSSIAEVSSSSSTTSSPSRRSTGSSRSRPNNNSWDWDGQSNFYRDPPPRFQAARKHPQTSPTASPLPLSLINTTPQTPSAPLTPLDLVSTNHRSPILPSPSPSPAPSRPLGRRTPTPRLPQTPPPNPVSAQTQIASLKGALEAAKMREEKNRLEAERLAKECEMMRWRWTEDSGHWRRREAEMQGYIQYLTQHVQMYVATGAHLQAPGTPSFSPLSPMSPPTAFNSPYAYPPGGPVPHPALATFFAAGPSSSSSSTGSRSPGDRGRRRERAGEEGEYADIAEGQSEEEDRFVLSDEVAGAILKRPDSLRVKSRTRVTPPVDMGALRFPSLSDLGNVWREPEPGREPLDEESEEGIDETGAGQDGESNTEVAPQHVSESGEREAAGQDEDAGESDRTPLADNGLQVNGIVHAGG